MNTITRAEKYSSIEDDVWQRFYEELHSNTVFDWPKEWGHPYAFKWADDIQRDKVVNWLCQDESGKTDLPVAQLLRWLLWMFRASQYRRRANLGEWFDRHRWRWATNADAMQDTGLTLKQLRRAVAILEARGLIRVVRDYRLNNYPHYRPSADLFRLCRYLTRYTDAEFLSHWVSNMSEKGVTSSALAGGDDLLRSAGSLIHTRYFDEARRLVVAFAMSKAAERFDILWRDWTPIERRAFGEH